MTAPGEHDPREQGHASRQDRDGDPRPGVALRATGVPLPLLMALAMVLALALFLFLDGPRRARFDAQAGQASAATPLPPAPPPLAIPPLPPPPVPVVIQETPAATTTMAPPTLRAPLPPAMPRPAFVSLPAPPGPAGRSGPALVVDLTSGSGAAMTGGDGGAGAAVVDDTIRATLIRNRALVIPQGAILTAVLETPLNSDRPGLARAIVSHDAQGFDGTRVLVPRGSRLIGEFKADTSPGMRRILITWTRLIRPDGVAIRIGSPVSDTLGGAGVPGQADTHFLARFASAVLQSALAVGVNLASQVATSGNTVYFGLPAQTAQLGQQLVPNANRPATVKVREGAEITVMVAHDLDFSGTPAVR
jgi:type IV secretion system protein VirB10